LLINKVALSNNLFYLVTVEVKATYKIKISAMVALNTIALIYSLNLRELKNSTKNGRLPLT